jgi:hypothetical protein
MGIRLLPLELESLRFGVFGSLLFGDHLGGRG